MEKMVPARAWVLPDVVGEERGILIRGGPESRGTWGVFRGAGPERFHL